MKRILSILPALCTAALLAGGCATVSRIADKFTKQDSVPAHSGTRPDINVASPSAPEPILPGKEMPSAGQITLPGNVKATSGLQDELITIARSKLGCKYSYASKGPDTFDCSGFMIYVFGQKGIRLEASSRAQYTQGQALDRSEPLRPCDLVFFSGRKVSNEVGHVGMVLDYNRKTGEFTFIHAAISTGIEIQSSKAPYYALRYIGARRILHD